MIKQSEWEFRDFTHIIKFITTYEGSERKNEREYRVGRAFWIRKTGKPVKNEPLPPEMQPVDEEEEKKGWKSMYFSP